MILSLVWVPGPSQSPGPQTLSEDSDIQKYRIKPGPRAEGQLGRWWGEVRERHQQALLPPDSSSIYIGAMGEAKASTRAKALR